MSEKSTPTKEELIYVTIESSTPEARNYSGNKFGGIKENLLVKELTELERSLVICCVCKGLLRGSYFTDKGYKCQNCLSRSEDRKPVEVNQPVIDTLKVHCPMKDEGCSWENRLDQLSLHVDQCEYFPISCPMRCVNVISRGDRTSHVENDCEMREVSCEFCQITLKAGDVYTHVEDDCQKVLRKCPNECCQDDFMQKELKEHLNQFCPLAKIPCPFSKFGCETKLLREEMEGHEIDFQIKHLRIMGEHIGKMEKVLQESNIGGVVWEVSDLKNQMKLNKYHYSKPFYVGCYKFQAFTNLNDNYTKAVGVFIKVVKGDWDDELEWPFRGRITFTLVNKMKESRCITKTYQVDPRLKVFEKPTDTSNYNRGYIGFASHDQLKSEKFSLDNAATFKVNVECLKGEKN